MRINRLHLENYRIHENLDVEFDKGINLLLGENGKGKSSILEAIGYALFGSDLRGTQKEAIKYGKKSGKIEVEFTGIDGEDYIVTKRLPGGASIYSKANPDLELHGKEERIRELCGIKGDIKDIYDNVIVAKQNEFISTFKAKPADREKIFDRVFNTEIYKEIYEGYSLKTENIYKNNLEIEKKSVENIKDIMENPKDLEENLKFERESENEFKKHLDILILEKKELREKLNKISLAELEIEKIKGNIRQIDESIKNFLARKDRIVKRIEESLEAKKIADENRDKYESYSKNSEVLQGLKKERKTLESIGEKQNELEKSLISLEKLEGDYTSKIELLKSKIESLKIDCDEKREKADSLKDEILEKNKNIEKYRVQLDENKPILAKLEAYEEKIKEWEDKIKGVKIELKERKRSLNLYISEKDQLSNEDLEEKLKSFTELENKKKRLETERDQSYSLGKANDEAYKKLKSSICPFLNETCKNLSGKNIDSFFISRKEEYKRVYLRSKSEIEKIDEKLKEKEEIVKKLNRCGSLINDIEKESLVIESQESKLEIAEMKLENKKNEYEKWKIENKISSREEILSKNTELETKIKNENSKRDIEERENLLKNIENSLNSIVELEKEIVEKEEKIKNLGCDKENIKNEIEENKPTILKYQSLNSEVEKYELLLKDLEKANQMYLENYKKALEKESLEAEKIKLEEDFEVENRLLIESKNELKTKEDEIISMDKKGVEEQENKKDEEISETKEKLGKISGDIKNLEEKLARNSEQNSMIEEKLKIIEKLSMKLELTKRFREKIKSMGKEVSKNMLKEIEILATENFRKITGRGEKIIWSNEDKDKYSVYLSGDRGDLRFEQLSGGEQVAVAISIRGAMSELFTESRFSIFDEPTNNLDYERRRSLAESIGEILKNLEQSIIVTHDDTFREMAQKVIEL